MARAIETNDDSGLDKINKFFAEYSKPQDFDESSTDNALLKADTHFENLCAILESNGVNNPAEMSVMQFYLRFEYYKKYNTANKAHTPREN